MYSIEVKKRKDLYPSSDSILYKEVITLLDVRSELTKALKGVEVNKGTSYQPAIGRRNPDKVVRFEYTDPKVVHHIGRSGDYRYVL